MKTNLTDSVRVAGLLLGALVLGAGCASKGPAERAGESVDRGVENVRDAINPPGPVEKAGRSVDKVLNR